MGISRTATGDNAQMENSALHFLVLTAAAVPVIVGFSQSRKVTDGTYARSSVLYGRAALLVMIGTAITIGVDSDVPMLISIAVAMVALAAGLAIQANEVRVFTQFAAEQRVDILSGLPNERLFYERLQAEHSRTKRTNVRYAVAIFEIDGVALFSEADQLNGMKLLAESLSESIRKTDTLGRIGERQVAVLLVDTQPQGASIGCERACERFFFQSCGHSDHAHVTRPMTLSVGIAGFDDDTVDPHHVVENAKLALRNLQNELGSGIRVYERDEFVRAADVDLSPPDANTEIETAEALEELTQAR